MNSNLTFSWLVLGEMVASFLLGLLLGYCEWPEKPKKKRKKQSR